MRTLKGHCGGVEILVHVSPDVAHRFESDCDELNLTVSQLLCLIYERRPGKRYVMDEAFIRHALMNVEVECGLVDLSERRAKDV